MRIRPLEPDDVPAAARVAMAALDPYIPAATPGRQALVRRRTAHFVDADPGGAWAAEEDGEVVGVALAILRGGIWGLSVAAVHPDRHARGAGGRLLRAALGHGGGGRGALIASSTDPRAMRLYARAGFDLRPCVGAGGVVDRSAIPAGLRSRPTDDLEAAGAVGERVRGAAYAPADLAVLDLPVLAVPGRGFAVHDDGSPTLLCADDEAVAEDLLWSCFAAGPRGGTVGLDLITAGQDWAVQAVLAAGLALTPDGPLFTRGELGPLRPWLPSGTLL